MNNNYVLSQPYETFIKFARLCERDEHGARNSHMQNLMDKEIDGQHVSHLKHDKLLNYVKKHMLSATKFAIKRKIEKQDKEKLQSYLPLIEGATDSSILLVIAEEGIELLHKYHPNLF